MKIIQDGGTRWKLNSDFKLTVVLNVHSESSVMNFIGSVYSLSGQVQSVCLWI